MKRLKAVVSLAVIVMGYSIAAGCAEVSPRPSEEPSVTPSPMSSASPAPLPAATPKPKPKKSRSRLPLLLQQIEDKYAQSPTLTAEFTQINLIAALNQTKTSTGTLIFKRPGKVRWETTKPDPNLLVSDGKTYWYYTPPFDADEHGQLIEKKSTEVQSRLANTLLSGSFSMAKDMVIKQESPSRFLLIPKKRASGTITQTELEVNVANKLIEKVTLTHKGGNRTEITLNNIELGKDFPDSTFTFTPPPNTDRVDADHAE